MRERAGTGSLLRRLGLAIALGALALPARAAETWLHPVLPQAVVKAAPAARRGARPTRPPVPPRTAPFPTALAGESSLVELTTGERYPEAGAAVPPERIDRTFVRLGSGRPMPLTSPTVGGPRTRLEATWAGQGLATLAVLLAPEARTEPAAAFEAFLREAGASEAVATRQKKKETKKEARVVAVESARSFAAVVAPPRSAVTADPASGRDEALGLPLEIVASVPPLPVRAGSAFAGSVLLDGQPFAGAVVRVYAPGADAPVTVVADAQGGFTLPLEQEGRLLLATASVRRTVKADRAKGEAWKRADWEVGRTTLELLVLSRPPVAGPAPKGRPSPKRTPR